MSLGNFIFELEADLDVDAQLSFTRLLFDLDFGKLEIGGLKTFFNAEFTAALGDIGFSRSFTGSYLYPLHYRWLIVTCELGASSISNPREGHS